MHKKQLLTCNYKWKICPYPSGSLAEHSASISTGCVEL